MTALRRLLTPGWALGLVGVVAFASLCFVLLAPWQLGKSDRLDERNRRLTDSVTAAPLDYDPSLLAAPDAYSAREWHRVTVHGSYVPGTDALLRLRSVDGDLVYQVLTVFRPDSGSEVLVNRGHVPVGENNAVPDYPAPPTGPVTVTARLRVAETAPAEPIDLAGHRAVRAITPSELSTLLGHPLESRGYLQLTGDQPGVLAPMPVPDVETGPYLSYGLQWIAFGVLAPLGLAYFAWAEVSARRRDADGDAAAGTPGPRPDPQPSPRAPVETASTDRYGVRFDAEQRRARRTRNRLADE